MKKILFFICTLDDGGAQRVVSMLSSKMAERGFDVEVLKYYKSENIYPISDNVKITTVEEETNTTSKFKNMLWMRKYFKKNTDVVISFLATYNMLALCANIGNNIPIIVADRNDPRFIPKNKLVRKLRNLLYILADEVVVQTTYNKKYFSKAIQEKCEVIMNPFSMKDKIGIALDSKKENYIVSVGRLEKQKNQLMLINAYNNGVDRDYKLIIYGEGPYRKVLEDRINELKLNNYIILPGSVDNILDKIKTANLFVISSDYEGMPNSLAEAMCIGLPVISTNVSGSSDLIENNKNGVLIKCNDENALISSIKKIIEDKKFSEEISNNACDISKKIDIDNIANKWIEIVNRL